MTVARFIILLAVVLGMGAPAEDRGGGLELPRWRDDLPPLPLGAGLWPDEFRPEDVVHPAIAPGPEGVVAPIDRESWLRFLPRGLFSGARREVAEAQPHLVEISPEALRACEHAPAETRVLDPHGLLAEAQLEDLSRLLAFHAEQAGVEARFLVLEAHEKLPGGVDLSGLASGALQRGTMCLTVFPLGAPGRARLFLSRNIAQTVPAEYLGAMVNACLRDAMTTSDPVDQLQRFATQLSIRLFWLERAHPDVRPAPPEVAAPVPVAVAVLPEPLSEITPQPAARPRESLPQFLWRCSKPFIGPAAGLVLGAGLVVVLLRRWLNRRRRQAVWLLPEYDHGHVVQFGGPHCGGCGASVKYG